MASDASRALSGLAVGEDETVGRFRYAVADDRWWWSDAMFRIHGFEPGEVTATSDLLLAHKHPEDADFTQSLMTRALDSGEPFSCHHRIVDASRNVRHVVAVGDLVTSADGKVTELHGFLIDVTQRRNRTASDDGRAAIDGAMQYRAVIEQAKGAVAFVYGIDADAAFALLRACSNDSNVKVHVVAQRILDASGPGAPAMPAAQHRMSDLLGQATRQEAAAD